MKEGISKGMNMKWSLYMSSNQQNLTIGSIRLKSDYRVVKISLTTGLGSYPGSRNRGWMLRDAGMTHWYPGCENTLPSYFVLSQVPPAQVEVSL